MASIMRLRPEHKQYHMVTNPVVASAKPLSTEEVEQHVQAYLDDPSEKNREAAIMSFGSIIRHILGRYIGTFRSLRSMEDDLVSVALMTVMAALERLETGEGSCRIVTRRIHRDVTQYVNKYRTSSAPQLRTQLKRASAGEPVLYAVPINRDAHDSAEVDESLMQFEVLSSLYALELSDLEWLLLQPENWGMSAVDLAKKHDLPRRTVTRVLSGLIEKAKEVLYAD